MSDALDLRSNKCGFLIAGVLRSMAPEKIVPQRKYYIGETIKKLIKNKTILSTNGDFYLSTLGKSKLAKYELDDLIIEKPKVWDGQFRVIIFDIAESKRSMRVALRKQLVCWGFIRLQNSVWAYPYECQELIALLKTSFGVFKDVIYMTVGSIENDGWLKKEFNLK